VPSFDSLTPLPAFAFVAPFGNTSSGHIFTQAAVQAVLLGFKT